MRKRNVTRQGTWQTKLISSGHWTIVRVGWTSRAVVKWKPENQWDTLCYAFCDQQFITCSYDSSSYDQKINQCHIRRLSTSINASNSSTFKLQLVADLSSRRRGRLRSSTSNLLDVRPSRLVTVGDRSFATAGPRLWNSLPVDVQSAPSLTKFRHKLTTHLFRLSTTSP